MLPSGSITRNSRNAAASTVTRTPSPGRALVRGGHDGRRAFCPPPAEVSVGRAFAGDTPVLAPGVFVSRLRCRPLLGADARELLRPAAVHGLQAPLRRLLARPDRLAVHEHEHRVGVARPE